MNHKKLLLFIPFFIIVLITLFGCSSIKDITTDKIKTDVQKISDVTTDYNQKWQVTDITEQLVKKEDKQYKTTVCVELENLQYTGGKKTVDLYYSYYDKGGWILENYENVSSISGVKPKAGVPEATAKSDLKLSSDETATLVSHDTFLDHLEDKYVFSVDSNGVMWNEKKNVTISYSAKDNGFWRLSNTDSSEITREFNINDDWFYSTYEDTTRFYKIKSFTETSARITEVYAVSSKYRKDGLSHNYNERYLSEDNIETDYYVCNSRECSVEYDDENDCYYISALNKFGDYNVSTEWIKRNGFYCSGRLCKTTSDITEIATYPIPENVKSWLDNH